jgi:hypothetical protein
MTKRQFLILLITSLTLVVLTGINFYLQVQTQRLNYTAQQLQNIIIQARQTDGPLQNLATRIANDSEKEPRLKEILAKRGVKATLNTEGQAR